MGVPVAGLILSDLVWPTGATPATQVKASRYVLLGPTPKDFLARLVDGLSRRVFDQVTAALKGRSLRVTSTDRVIDDITRQINTGYRISGEYLSRTPPPFDVERFDLSTGLWSEGRMLIDVDADVEGLLEPHVVAVRSGHRPVRDLLAGATVVGMPELPCGTVLTAHYLDEGTGAVMRVVGALDVVQDEFIVRWDMLLG